MHNKNDGQKQTKQKSRPKRCREARRHSRESLVRGPFPGKHPAWESQWLSKADSCTCILPALCRCSKALLKGKQSMINKPPLGLCLTIIHHNRECAQPLTLLWGRSAPEECTKSRDLAKVVYEVWNFVVCEEGEVIHNMFLCYFVVNKIKCPANAQRCKLPDMVYSTRNFVSYSSLPK